MSSSGVFLLGWGVQLRHLLRESHLLRDPVRPLLDLIPVPEVAFGQSRPGGRQLPQRPFGETEPAGIKDTEEDAVLPRVDDLLELGELPWLGRRVQVNSLGVSGWGALPSDLA